MASTCGRCGAQNSGDSRFCSNCGGPLDPAFAAIKDFIDTTLRDQVREIIAKEYRDQNVVQVETTQAIASKLSDWVKLFGFFVGIPVAVFLLILALLGINTYSDFMKKVEKAQVDATARLNEAQVQAGKLKNDGDQLAAEYAKLGAQYKDTAALAGRLNKVSDQVDVINEKLGFTTSSNIAPDLKVRLEQAYAKFYKYLQKLGYKSTSGPPTIDIQEKLICDTVEMISCYDSQRKMLRIEKKFADEPALLYREFLNYVLQPDGDLDDLKLIPYYAIGSALAWYLPCSYLDDPNPASKTGSWDLSKKHMLTESIPDLAATQDKGAVIWGSVFWELRKSLAKDAAGDLFIADKLLFQAWFKFSKDEARTQGGAAFVRGLLELDKPHAERIRAIFAERGLTL